MYYLGVDGGGTKTGFSLIDEAGRIIAAAFKGSSYYIQTGFDAFRQIMAEGIGEVCREAGITAGTLDFSFLGLPAFGEIQADVPLLEEIVRDILGNERFRCGNDVEAGWAGSLACQPGINIVAGTGAIGFGRDSRGHAARAGGWGDFCGDEGSAYWLGKQLISLFGKQSDGRMDRTPLYGMVREQFAIATDFDFIAIIYEQLMPKREEIAKLAVLVYRAAQQGDARALDLYEQAAYEHSLTVKAILNQLCFRDQAEVPVSYSGGVFKAGELILAPLRKYLAAEPVRLITPLLAPVTGAALYAMKLSGQSVTPRLIAQLQKQETEGASG